MSVLTKDQCGKVLEKYTGSKEFDIISYYVTPIQFLDGLLAEQHFVTVHYQFDGKARSAKFFLKLISDSNKLMFSIAKDIYAFEKESFYYETIVPLLQAKGISVGYVPKCYFSEPYVIVMEDVSVRSFKGTPKNKPLDLKHTKKCLETLAKFHVGPILYELAKTEELGKKYSLMDEYGDILESKVFCNAENGATKHMRCCVKSLFQLIEVLPENGINKTDFQVALQAALDQIMLSRNKPMEFRTTVLHGDLWSNNFLHQYSSDGTEIVDCVLIDFQTLNYGAPALDVLQFLQINTRKSLRDEHLEELLKHYYDYFSRLLVERGYQPTQVLSESEFQTTCKVFALPAKLHSILDRSITFTSDEYFLEAYKKEETFSKYIFEDRGKYVINDFNNNDRFRELMIEDITELREILFAK